MSRYQNDTYMLEALAARMAARNVPAGNSPAAEAYKSVLQAVQQR